MAEPTAEATEAESKDERTEPEKPLFTVGFSPHIRASQTTANIMGWVIVAVLPITVYGVYIGGWSALWVLLSSIAGCMITEAVVQRLRHLPVTLWDMSALLSGLLLGLTLPPRLPFWMAALAGAAAMLIGKHVFGGLGHNIFNPALVGRAIIFVSYARAMTTSYLAMPAQSWVVNTSTIKGINAVTNATPLAALGRVRKNELAIEGSRYVKPLLFGNPWGQIGEVSAILILVGLGILLVKGIVDWRIPVVYVGTTVLLSWVLGMDPWVAMFAGGLLFGACFMATDYVTNPMTAWGKVIFALGCGVITTLLRFYSSLPEGVMFAILMMNGVTPVIDRWVKPRAYGHKWREKGSQEPAGGLPVEVGESAA